VSLTLLLRCTSLLLLILTSLVIRDIVLASSGLIGAGSGVRPYNKERNQGNQVHKVLQGEGFHYPRVHRCRRLVLMQQVRHF